MPGRIDTPHITMPALASPVLSRRCFISSCAAIMGVGLIPTPIMASEVHHSSLELSCLQTIEQFESFAAEHCADLADPVHFCSSYESLSDNLRSSQPYWGVENGSKAFYRGDGGLYLTPALKVIDVSKWQGDIDWAQVKNTDVDAVIIRAGFGVGNTDQQFLNNIQQCEYYKIPYGIYLYSYAYDAEFAAAEARWTASLIEKFRAKPSLPIFFDLEQWGSWRDSSTGVTHYCPTSPSTYKRIVDSYFSVINSLGYPNVAIYSYTNYLNTALNDSTIHARVKWVAQYGPSLKFNISQYTDYFGWQYSASESVPGINGSVDMNVFTPTLYGFSDVTPISPHQEDIGWMKNNGYATGFEDGTFGGWKDIIRQDMAAFLYRIAGSPSYSPSDLDMKRFKDVSPSTPHHNEVWWLGATGVAEGFADGTFGGWNKILRQDMAAFLYRLAGSPAYNPSTQDMKRFTDVTTATPHCREVWWLGATGISTGYPDGTFGGTRTVLRQDMAAFLHRFFNYTGGKFLNK